ncbi:MAG: hypothetical protein HOB84_09905 [Candidatus Marinimicrobia bacterium]|jgi:hypothetical protein|nr:hypothetical protein [Candidatus Neomarinimicrobiota bacterium]MBT4360817.1 hypothetical protein [Candidatus Neomarinimicrobiota bacterium]MBT4715075.1 hypothetical protein [Candidatus Neomarinimicrobiota bacterium]MBT4945784.1 hypothetical protein [Candidatus Neomarinimicrobiota bacterium]MBT5271085.1 hypothetical protein [Candidatus Neomarinimicrobiota bacterium]
MKTLLNILIILSLSSFLLAQTDSTTTEAPPEESAVEAPLEEEAVDAVEPAAEDADTTETQTEEMVEAEAVEMDSTSMEVAELDSVAADTTALVAELDSMAVDTTAFVAEDTVVTPEPVMGWVQNDPAPAALAGLVNEGNLYFWTNDVLEGLDFTSLSYISIVDPTMIAVKANDCLDIVCHLLASDGSGVNYVVVTKDDSSNVQIYNTVTKIVAIEAPADSIVAALDTYLKEIAGSEYLALATEDTTVAEPVFIVDQDELARQAAKMKTMKIRNRQFRSLEDIGNNPANLARDFENFVSLNLLPDFKFSIHNSLLTPGWYTNWWTAGGVWDASMKADYLSTITDKELALNIAPDFHTLLGFRIGRFAINLSGKSHMKMVLPGNTLGLPMQDILFDQPVENGGLEIEAIPFVGKTSLSYAQPLQTPLGEIKVGLGVNIYEAVGYMNIVSDDFTIMMTRDSTVVTASGEGWVTEAGAKGKGDNPDMDDFDPMDATSNISVGFDIGAIMDLQSYLHQEVEVQVSLKNLGAKYKWSDITHTAWTMDMVLPLLSSGELDTLDIEQYQTTTDTTLSTSAEVSIDVPTVFSLNAIYQPIPQVMVGIGIEKAFTDEVHLGYSPDLELNYQLNLYATPWLDFSYYKQNQFGDPVHTFGSGLHLGFLETGFTLSFINGLNTDAKGIGFGLSSSIHF